jgi:pimeloyl-ACP methyl ester carboxylesterase
VTNNLRRHVAVCVCLSSFLHAAPIHTDGRWVFENDVLRVMVHDDQMIWDVLDKRCDRLWRQSRQKPREQWIVPVGKAATAPQLDGDLGEWMGAGIPVSSTSVRAQETTADSDCSARFHFAWNAAGIWLAADVTDETRSGLVPGAAMWHVDSVELWLGKEHWGLIPDGDNLKIECWSNPRMAEGCRGATRPSATGWGLEAFVPWNRITALEKTPRTADTLMLAFGVNDSDGAPKRECQLFYPPAYIHKQYRTHAMAELAAPGDAPPPRPETARPLGPIISQIQPLPAPTEGVQIELSCPEKGGAMLPLTARVWLLPGVADVGFELSGNPATAFTEVSLPAPFVLDEPAGKLVIPQASGLLFGVEETSWNGKHLGGVMSMPWFGQTDLATGQGYIAIFQTPDDAKYRGARVPGEKRDVLSVRAVFQPQKGKFGYARRMLFHFSEKGAYTPLAKRYRAHVIKTGLLKTLSEKRRDRPNIDRMVGAVNIYCSTFSNIRELHRRGVERIVVSGFSSDHVRQLNEWGYLPGRYDIYTDLYQPGTHPSKMERCEGFSWPEDVIKNREGEPVIGWCPITDPKTGEKVPSYVICWTCGLRTLKEKMPKRLARSPYTSYFLDCVTSTGLRECYDPNHPLTRTTDRETRVAQFAYLSGELGLIVGSETGRDWAVGVADYLEGIMSTAAFFANPKSIHEIPFVSCESTPRYEEYGTNPRRRVPLFQLVYNDCMETTWRWGDNTHRMPKLWAQKDLLHMIHASMPTWILWGPQQGLFWGNLDRFVECYTNVCRWRRAVGYSEMLSHERLTQDGLLQRSTFANGAAVTVNFAHERYAAGGTELPPRSYLITGNAPELAGLPVGKPVQVDDSWEPMEFVTTGNTGFEREPTLWRGAGGTRLTVQKEIVHTGKRAARISGTASAGWSYAAAPKVPIKAGKRYRLQGWLRVEALDATDPAPAFKCALYSNGKYRTNIYSSLYDLSKIGTWQKLERAFTAPASTDQAGMALEKRTKESRTATLFIDDMELVSAEPEAEEEDPVRDADSWKDRIAVDHVAPMPGDAYPDGTVRIRYTSVKDGNKDWALYLPGDSSKNTIVYMHGSFSEADQIFTRKDIRDFWLTRVRKGKHPLLSVNLRGTSYMSPGATEDTAGLLAYARAKLGCRKIVLLGGSGGASSAMAYACVHPETVDGVIAMGMCDLLARLDFARKSPIPVLQKLAKTVFAAYGGPPEKNSAPYQARSVLARPDRLTMPVVLTMGESDALIPVQETRKIAVAMRDKPGFVYHEVPKGNHDSALWVGVDLQTLTIDPR